MPSCAIACEQLAAPVGPRTRRDRQNPVHELRMHLVDQACPTVGAHAQWLAASLCWGLSHGAIAQMGERLDRTQEVAGSIPASSTLESQQQREFRALRAGRPEA